MSEEGVDEVRTELIATEQLLKQAIGGWRGMIDSGLPTAVFLIVLVVSGQQLLPAAIAASVTAAVVAVWRLIRKQDLSQVIAGVVGVAFSAWISTRTGKSEDFFIPSLLTNLGYGSALLIGNLVRHPLMGYVVGGLKGDLTSWRNEPASLKFYTRLSWLWVGVFGLRLLVKTPLYLAGNVEVLGVVHLAMGWPLYLAAVYVTYRAVKTRN